MIVASVLLAGCGFSAPASSGPDGDGEASVTVLDHGVPVAGATVYFQDPDSTLVDTVLTDEHGVATATIQAGSFVTIVRDHWLQTFAGVRGGDHLNIAPQVHANVEVPDPGAKTKPLAVSVTAVPTTIASVDVYRDAITAAGVEFEASADVPLTNASGQTTVPVLTGDGITALTVTHGYPDPTQKPVGEPSVFEWGPAGEYSLAFGPALLRAYTALPTWNRASAALEWSEAANGVVANVARASIGIVRPGAPPPADNPDQTTDQAWSWDLVGPRGDAATLAFPVLPDVEPAAIRDTDLVNVAELMSFHADDADVLRVQGFAAERMLVTPGSTGRLVEQRLFTAPL